MSDVRGEGPADVNDEGDALAAWVAELAERLEGGEPVDLDALAEAHPEGAEELRRLLPTIRRMASFGEAVRHGPDPIGAPDQPAPAAGLGTLGDFRLLREVGRGGMGIVYEAEQISLGRRVALKILPLAGALDPRHYQRFLLEARAAACLHHAHIVPVHAVGSERGVPFYAMQFIDGYTLAKVLRELRGRDEVSFDLGSPVVSALATGLTLTWIRKTAGEPSPPPTAATGTSLGASHRERRYIRAVAEQGRRAAEALDHAHSRGVLHRDIKPANLMLDVAGHLWVTDFGLALVQGDSHLTLTGDVVGTLRYMSPEQTMARRGLIDGRTDIYSLGATLYELLTLRPVFDGGDRSEILRKIAQDQPIPLRKVNPAVPRDLETIIHKTLAKEPSDRYATARDLADDLGRFLDARSITARPPGWLERLGRWARRNRALVASVALFAVLAVLSLGGGLLWSNNWLRAHNERLRKEHDRAGGLSRELESQRDLAEQRRLIADHHLYAFRLRQAGEALVSRRFEKAQEILLDCQPGPDEDDLRGFAWHHLWRESRRAVEVLSGRDELVRSLALSADGRLVATGDRDGTIRIRDTATGAIRRRFRGPRLSVSALAFSTDGRRIASGASHEFVASRADVGEVRVWEVESGRTLARVDGFETRDVWNLRFDPSGDYLWVQSLPPDGRLDIGLWKLEGGPGALHPRLIRRWRSGENFSVSADGRRVAGFEDVGCDVVVEEPLSGRPLCRLTPMDPGCHGLGFSPDGRLLATARVKPGGPLRLDVWEVETGRRLLERGDLPSGWSITEFEFSPDGRSLLAQGFEGTMRLYDLDTGTSWANQVDPGDESNSFGNSVLLSGGLRLAWSYRNDHTGSHPLRVYERAGGALRATFPGRLEPVSHLFGLPDGGSIVFLSGGRAVLWHFEPAPESQPAGHADEAWAIAFSGDGRLLASGADDDDPQTLKLWDAATGRFLRGWKAHDATTGAVAFQPGGRVLATACLLPEHNLRLWDAATGELLAALDGHTDKVRTVAFRPDGRLLASAGSDRTIRLWDVAARRCLRILAGHSDAIRQLAFSPDGRILASAGNDATVRLWDVDTGRALWTWEGDVKISAVAFAPDGHTLAWAHEDGVLQRWDLARRRLLAPLHSEYDELRCLTFSPDGRTLAAAGKSGTLHLWDPIVGQELLPLEGRPCQANALAFSPDGSALSACWHDGTVRIVRSR